MVRAHGEGPEARRPEDGLAADRRRREARAVEGVPEAQGLVAARRDARDLERDLDRLGAAGGEQDPPRPAGHAGREALGQLHRGLAGEAPRGEGQLAQLALDGGDDPGRRVSEVVRGVAVQVEVAPPVGVDDPRPLGARDRRQAGGRERLAHEGPGVALEQRPGGVRDGRSLHSRRAALRLVSPSRWSGVLTRRDPRRPAAVADPELVERRAHRGERRRITASSMRRCSRPGTCRRRSACPGRSRSRARPAGVEGSKE